MEEKEIWAMTKRERKNRRGDETKREGKISGGENRGVGVNTPEARRGTRRGGVGG